MPWQELGLGTQYNLITSHHEEIYAQLKVILRGDTQVQITVQLWDQIGINFKCDFAQQTPAAPFLPY